MPRAALACLFAALSSRRRRLARGRRAEPLPYIELVTGGAAADAELPLIIALHGRGDTAEDFAPLFRDFAVPARVAVLRPPHAWGGGQAWFIGARAHVDNRAAIAAELLALADRVVATAEAIRARPSDARRPVVMGFSQGGMLAWAVALEHPRAFSAAFPASGFLFPEMLEQTAWRRFRDAADRRVSRRRRPAGSVDEDRRGVRLLEKRGVRVDLRVYPGVGHELPPVLRANLFAALARALAR